MLCVSGDEEAARRVRRGEWGGRLREVDRRSQAVPAARGLQRVTLPRPQAWKILHLIAHLALCRMRVT